MPSPQPSSHAAFLEASKHLKRSYRDGEARYHLSFWSVPYRTTTGCFFQIPYMSGFGGNLIVLLPSRVSAFRFADVLTDSRLLF